jgi:hypothetical protein
MDADAKKPVVDWLHVPGEATVWDLYASMHDGCLAAESDVRLDVRELTLHFTVAHVAAHHGLPADSTWSVLVSGLESVRVALFIDAPTREPPGGPGVEMSISWHDFIARVAASNCDIYRASLAATAASAAIHLEFGLDQPYAFGQLWARGLRASISDSLGNQITPDAFVALGEAYWEAWAKRHESK